jgi:hypothetical protein
MPTRDAWSTATSKFGVVIPLGTTLRHWSPIALQRQ